MKRYPALDVSGASPDLILARVLDFGANAAEELGPLVRVFFPDAAARDAAQQALAGDWSANAVDVADEDWARRSQENLKPVTVGRITVLPRLESRPEAGGDSPPIDLITLVIQPSMGFGTGHHPTTRLCLAALQTLDLRQQSVLDVGTGSGILAIAAGRLGAAHVLGMDVDPDAIQSAAENLQLNPEAGRVSFEVADLTMRPLPRSGIVAANLTGPLLVRSAATLNAAAEPGGAVIVSGLLSDERDDVCRAFLPWRVRWEQEEEGWVGIVFVKRLAEIGGSITNEQGMPAPEYTVLAFSTDRSFWRPLARQIMTARPDQTGKYRIRGLPPGEYYVTTVDPAEQGEWFEPTYLDDHRAGAARVILAEGGAKTQDFRIRN